MKKDKVVDDNPSSDAVAFPVESTVIATDAGIIAQPNEPHQQTVVVAQQPLSGSSSSEEIVEIAIGNLAIVPALQSRVAIDAAVVAEYAEHYIAREPLPPPQAVFDGATYWVYDGFHRVAAAKVASLERLQVRVKRGQRRDALMLAAAANTDHGLRRTVFDKRKAVEILLSDAEWRNWSDRSIARYCRVSHPLVAEIRANLGVVTEKRQFINKHGTTSQFAPTTKGQQSSGDKPKPAGDGSEQPPANAAPQESDAKTGSESAPPSSASASTQPKTWQKLAEEPEQLHSDSGNLDEMWRDVQAGFQLAADESFEYADYVCTTRVEAHTLLVDALHLIEPQAGEYICVIAFATRNEHLHDRALGKPVEQMDDEKVGLALDAALRSQLKSDSRLDWNAMAATGVDNATLRATVAKCFGIHGGSDGEDGHFVHRGGKNPSVVFSSWRGAQEVELKGVALLERVRSLMGLPSPQSVKKTTAPDSVLRGGVA